VRSCRRVETLEMPQPPCVGGVNSQMSKERRGGWLWVSVSQWKEAHLGGLELPEASRHLCLPEMRNPLADADVYSFSHTHTYIAHH
jgi:hypothetical protein